MSFSKNEKKAPKKPRSEAGAFPECTLLIPAASILTMSEEVVTEMILYHGGSNNKNQQFGGEKRILTREPQTTRL